MPNSLKALEDRSAHGDAGALVDLARRYDARGEHPKAIDYLTQAAQADHPAALRLLGVRLSSGRNAPGRPYEGIQLIRKAAQLGDGEALALLAVFAAVGYLEAPDWARAIDQLRAAAEAGWAPAHRQLALLAAGPDGSGTAIDLAAWREPAATQSLSASPRIMSIAAMVTPAVCTALIDDARARLVRAQVHDPITGQPIVEKTRTNRLFTKSLFDTDLLSLAVQERMAAAAGVTSRALEAVSILNYRPGEQSRPHYDFIDPAARSYADEMRLFGQRIATILIYLNDDYEGGETDFPELDISYRGKTGDALLFFSVDEAGQPDRRTVHAGRPPLRRQKWIVSQFVRSKARP